LSDESEKKYQVVDAGVLNGNSRYETFDEAFEIYEGLVIQGQKKVREAEAKLNELERSRL